MTEPQIIEYLSQFEGPWKIYPNPDARGGVFVYQDKPITPHPGVKARPGTYTLIVPWDAKGLAEPIPPDMAERVVEQLNR